MPKGTFDVSFLLSFFSTAHSCLHAFLDPAGDDNPTVTLAPALLDAVKALK